MAREALLVLAWLGSLLAFPAAAPDITASYLEDTTTEAMGETSIISTEQYVQKRTFEHSISLNGGSVTGDLQRHARSEETWSSAGDFSFVTGTFGC
ncbi:hypothetical protein Q9233_002603 [Columba guinea]|nr:hypothetical protein Q9233_002603 [Columba guinea]